MKTRKKEEKKEKKDDIIEATEARPNIIEEAGNWTQRCKLGIPYKEVQIKAKKDNQRNSEEY